MALRSFKDNCIVLIKAGAIVFFSADYALHVSAPKAVFFHLPDVGWGE